MTGVANAEDTAMLPKDASAIIEDRMGAGNR
jgi:hypothetical protein